MSTKLDDTDVLDILARLEHQLIIFFRPTFLSIQEPTDDGTINIVIASNVFNNKTITERVTEVVDIINRKVPEAMEHFMVVSQTYDGKEMVNIIEETFGNDIR